MKTIVHHSEERGYAEHGWLKSYHSFSFASFYDPSKIHFGMLRVLNDDHIEGGMGFGMHPHDNMEIVTIPLSGTLEHKDSMGHAQKLETGEVQIMSAGSGLQHSEYNHSDSEPVELLQIWVFPKERNIKPRYDQKKFKWNESFTTFVSPERSEESLWINQDAYFSIADRKEQGTLNYKIKKSGNGAYIFLIEGEIRIANETLKRRDAIGIWETDEISMELSGPSTILIIEVPML